MKRALHLALALLWVSLSQAQAAPVQHAFLVQNSGWMEPFYVDPSSQLKPLVAAVAGAVSAPEDTVFALSFSQTSGSNLSPHVLAESRGGTDMLRQLSTLGLAHKGATQALADTDFQEAIAKTITGPFKSTPGILWIFTNNKNSPNNDTQTAARNRDFYRLLHLEPSITKTLVFPLKMSVQGKLYKATGLMVYALAYGQSAADALDRIMSDGKLSKVLTTAPARLKPVDQEAVRIVPLAVKNAPNVKVSLGSDQRTLVLDVQADKLLPVVTLQASLQNLFYPYVIRTARVESYLATGSQQIPIEVSPPLVSGLAPGASQPVEVQFTLPMAQVPSVWSAQAILAMGKQIILPMVVEISLSGQQLALSDGFAADLQALFPGDPISEVFTPPDSVRSSKARVPLLVRIQYPLLPVFLAMSLLLALMGALTALGLMSGRGKRFELMANDVQRKVIMKPFSRLTIRSGDGEALGEVRRGLGRPSVASTVVGHSLRFTER